MEMDPFDMPFQMLYMFRDVMRMYDVHHIYRI